MERCEDFTDDAASAALRVAAGLEMAANDERTPKTSVWKFSKRALPERRKTLETHA
jgi:hypothetical protein